MERFISNVIVLVDKYYLNLCTNVCFQRCAFVFYVQIYREFWNDAHLMRRRGTLGGRTGKTGEPQREKS